MEIYATNRFEAKIETFDPCAIEPIDGQREMSETMGQSQAEASTDDVKIQEVRTIQQQVTQQSEQVAGLQSNMALTPVRLPALLDGEFFSVIRVDDSNVTVRCLQCDKNLNGNLKSTGNFLSHIKRVHPFMIEKIKCKSNQRKPAIAYVDMSVDNETTKIVKSRRGYRKCYKTEEGQISSEDVADQPSSWSDSSVIRRRKYDEKGQQLRRATISTTSPRFSTESRAPNGVDDFTEIQPDETSESPKLAKLAQQNNSYVVEDEFDAIGRNVAAKLRNMRLDQRIVAEKLVNDVLFEAQLGTLHRDSSLHV